MEFDLSSLFPGGCERCGDNDHREEGRDQAGHLHHVQDSQVEPPQAEPEQHESQLQRCQDCQTKKGWGHCGVRMDKVLRRSGG